MGGRSTPDSCEGKDLLSMTNIHFRTLLTLTHPWHNGGVDRSFTHFVILLWETFPTCSAQQLRMKLIKEGKKMSTKPMWIKVCGHESSFTKTLLVIEVMSRLPTQPAWTVFNMLRGTALMLLKILHFSCNISNIREISEWKKYLRYPSWLISLIHPWGYLEGNGSTLQTLLLVYLVTSRYSSLVLSITWRQDPGFWTNSTEDQA